MDPVDLGHAAADPTRHRAPYPAKLFARLERLGVELAGRRALDLGTATGAVARELARRGAVVVGLDQAPERLRRALALDAQAGVRVAYVRARAERLPLADGGLQLVLAGRCWRRLEVGPALAETRRVLAPGGALVLASYDGLSLPGNLVEATEALIRAHDPGSAPSGGDGLHPEWVRQVAAGGYGQIESFSFDADEPYDHVGWRDRVRAGIVARLPQARVAALDDELAALLARRFPGEPLAVQHRLYAVVARRT